MTADSPLTSVIMPAYNARATIEDAIASGLGQSYQPIEVIVVDDGSVDGTADVVRKRFGDAVTLLREPHRGRAAARNRGLQIAKGELIQFLDADDLLERGKITRQVRFLFSHPEYAVAYGDIECFATEDPERRWMYALDSKPTGEALQHMVESGFVLTVAALVWKRWCQEVGGFDEELHGTEDWDLWLKIAAAGGLFAYSPSEVVGFYRVRTSQPSGPAAWNHLYMGVLALEKLNARLPRKRARLLRVRRAIGRWRFGYGRALLENNRRWKGILEMGRALLEDPRSWDYKLAWLVAGSLLGGTKAGRLIRLLQERRDFSAKGPTPG